MTKEEFALLRVGDVVELLNLKLERTGQFLTVISVGRLSPGIYYASKTTGRPGRLDNEMRVAFPLKREKE